MTLSETKVVEILQELLKGLPRQKFKGSLSDLITNHLVSPNEWLQKLVFEFTKLMTGSLLDPRHTQHLKKELDEWRKSQNMKFEPPSSRTQIERAGTVDWKEYTPAQSELLRPDLFNEQPTTNFKFSEPKVVVSTKKCDHKIQEILITHDESYSQLEIVMYKGWQDDLLRVLRSTEDTSSRVHPIFIPSFGRHSKIAKNALFNHEGKEKLLIYVVADQSNAEANRYDHALLPVMKDPITIVQVSIDARRGIGFSRSVINILQREMRKRLWEDKKIHFDYFWTIDDDMEGMRMLIDDSKSWSMQPCAVAWALSQSQSILEQKIERELLGKTDEILSAVMGEFLDVRPGILSSVFGRNVQQLVEYSLKSDVNGAYDRMKKEIILEHEKKKKKTKDLDACMATHFEKESFCEWFESKFIPYHRTTASTVQLSIISSKDNHIRNYNLLAQRSAHYVVSAKRYGCILNYAPGIDGYNYLSAQQVMTSQEKVKAEKGVFNREILEKRNERIQTVSDAMWKLKHDVQKRSITNIESLPQYELRDTFLDEHDRFTERLELDNKTGLNVFYFDVEYMPNKSGGCRTARYRRMT